MAGKTNSAGKKSGGAQKGGQLRHPDGSPRLPGFNVIDRSALVYKKSNS